MKDEMTLYLAGPMTGQPYFNLHSFSNWAAALRYHGFDVINPIEHGPPDVQWASYLTPSGDVNELPDSYEPEDTALRNVQFVARADGVAVMPDWQQSVGTRHEVETAHRFGLPVAPVQLWLAATGYEAMKALSLPDPDGFLSEEVVV